VTFTHRKATVPGAAGTGAACTVDGGTFRFRAAHFEWLMDFAAALGLPFESLGKRRHATPATLHFCDELIRLYGSEEWNVAMGASFAIENWAAAGFWQDLVDGLTRTRRPDLPIGFFVWHNRIEADHSRHTLDELAALAHHSQFDANAFVASGRQALDAVAVFWSGLDRDRRLQYHAAS
jgi:pyrroloquinoline quinone (PQQ) biosynthesis protein C